MSQYHMDVPINSLAYQCIRELVRTCIGTKITNNNNNDDDKKEATIRYDLAGAPIQVKQHILNYLVQCGVSIDVEHLYQLLHNGGVYHLDLVKIFDNYHDTPVLNNIMDMLCNDNRNLRTISLPIKNGKYFGDSYNFRTFNNLHTLEVIQLDQAMFVDIVMNCRNLQMLCIKQPCINDDDIYLNWMTNRKLRNGTFTLQYLEIPSSIQAAGLVCCLSMFTSLRHLKCARFERLIDFIEDGYTPDFPETLLDDELKERCVRTLQQLESLWISHPLGFDTVPKLVKHCPNLMELNLQVCHLMDISAISTLKNLRKLTLSNSYHFNVSYHLDVLPILEAIGENLQHLAMESFTVIDLTSIGKHCPNLKCFSAKWFTILGYKQQSQGLSSLRSKVNPMEAKPFSQLEYVRLRPNVDWSCEMGTSAIHYLLEDAKLLRHLELYNCKLNDSDVDQLIERNGLKELQRLILLHGHSISQFSVNKLLKNCTNLCHFQCGTGSMSMEEMMKIFYHIGNEHVIDDIDEDDNFSDYDIDYYDDDDEVDEDEVDQDDVDYDADDYDEPYYML